MNDGSGDSAEGFGACLGDLMDSRRFGHPSGARVTAAQLARALSVDSSLVHHWRADRRLPSKSYLKGIAAALRLTEGDRLRLKTAFERTEQLREQGQVVPRTRQHIISRSLQRASGQRSEIETVAPVPQEFTELPLDKNVISLDGTENIVRYAIRLVSQAQWLSEPHSESIYLTFAGMRDAVEAAGLHLIPWWHGAVRQALQNGWDVYNIINLDRNVQRSIGIIDGMYAYLGTRGAFKPFYALRPGTMAVPYGMCVAPGVGALLFLATHLEGHVDAAIYFPAQGHKHEIELLVAHCRQQLDPTLSAQLLENISADESGKRTFNHRLATAERIGGNRFLVKDGLSSLVFPATYYQDGSVWFEAQSALHRSEQSDLHLERLRSFYQHVQVHKYQDVCSKRAILRLVQHGLISRDDIVASTGYHILPEARKSLLEQVILLLHSYPNYELAILDEDEEGELLQTFWEAVGDHTVFLESWRPAEFDEEGEQEIELVITEPMIVQAYHAYGQSLWNKVRSHNRERDYVIYWLMRCLRYLTGEESDLPEPGHQLM